MNIKTNNNTITTETAQQTSPPHKKPKVSGMDPEHTQEKTRTSQGLCPSSSQKPVPQTEVLTEN